jgi:hypothetical protein
MTAADGMPPTAAGSPAENEESDEVPHGLRWGIKRSFIEYVRRMPDGRGRIGDGAIPVGSDEVFFSLDDGFAGDDGKPAAVEQIDGGTLFALRGDVLFSGHFGFLAVRTARPRLLLNGASSMLTVETDADPASRIPLVTAELDLCSFAATRRIGQVRLFG